MNRTRVSHLQNGLTGTRKMTSKAIRQRIAEHSREIEGMGVASLDLFGSAARDEATELSDIDLLVEFSRPVGLFAFYGLQEYLENLLDAERIDLVLRRAVVDDLKERIYAEAVPCLRRTGHSESIT